MNTLRSSVIALLCILVAGCATTVNVVQEKSIRFDEGVAAYDAGDYASAYRIWSTLAEENDLAAMRNTAHLYRKGQGVARDPRRAMDLYKEAAEKGLVVAMANVGDMYLEGDGVKRDADEAARWYARSAAGGLSLGMFKLAHLYERGEGVERDPARARMLIERAARNGFGPAQDKLKQMGLPAAVDTSGPAAQTSGDARSNQTGEERTGRRMAPISDTGEIVDPFRGSTSEPLPSSGSAVAKGLTVTDTATTLPPADPAALQALPAQDAAMVEAGQNAYAAGRHADALRIWKVPADRGVAEAQYRLGFLHETGKGTRQDVIEAYRWYKLSAAQSHVKGSANLKRIASQLTSAELAIANSLAASPAPASEQSKPAAASAPAAPAAKAQ